MVATSVLALPEDGCRFGGLFPGPLIASPLTHTTGRACPFGSLAQRRTRTRRRFEAPFLPLCPPLLGLQLRDELQLSICGQCPLFPPYRLSHPASQRRPPLLFLTSGPPQFLFPQNRVLPPLSPIPFLFPPDTLS